MNYQKQSTGMKIASGIAAGVMILAALGLYVPKQVPQAHADSLGISTSDITVSNSNNSASISISRSGPFDVDFRYTVCWSGNSGPACTTSAWASDAATEGGSWDQWIWPGYPGGMTPNDLYVQSVATRALPAGEYLDNVHIGLELSEDANGSLVGSTAPLWCAPGYAAITPDGGGVSTDGSTTNAGPTYAHEYGCSNVGPDSDVLQTFIYANILTASATGSNIPSTMTPGQTITNASVTITNASRYYYTAYAYPTPASVSIPNETTYNYPTSGGYNCMSYCGSGDIPDIQLAFKPSSITYTNATYSVPGNPAGSGCVSSSGGVFDSSGHAILDLPQGDDDSGNYYDCSFNATVTSVGLTLNHTGSFTTPSAITLTYPDAALQNWVQASSEGECYDPDVGNGEYYECENPGSSGFYGPQTSIPAGSSMTFTIPSFTAPTTPGTYTETWTLSDSDGNVPGATYSKTITVVGTGGTASVSSDRATTWQLVGGPSALQQTTPATSATYSNVTPDQYTLLDLNSIKPYGFNVSSASTGYVNPPSILARVIKTADASSCSSWTCLLSNGGTISYTMSTQYCSINVNAALNGGSPGLAGVAYTVAGTAPSGNSSSGTTTSGTNTFQLISDPTNAQTFDFTANSLSPTVTANGTTADFNGYTITRTSDGATVTNAYNGGNGGLACSPGDTLTFTASYKSRAVIQVK